LTLYLSDGQESFPIRDFLEFLESLTTTVQDSGSPLQFQRAIASSILFTAYASSNWQKSENHLGVAEAWLSNALMIIRLASELSLPEERWITSYELAFENSRNALKRLLDEADTAEDLVVPNIVDGIAYPTRALLVCGYIAAFFLAECLYLRGKNKNYGKTVKKILLRELPFIEVAGESGAPLIFSIATALELLDEPTEAAKVVIRWANTLTMANQPDSENALADPYHSLEEVLMASFEEDGLGERFDGHAYTLHLAIDWLARRQLRPIIEQMWPKVTKLTLCEFICSKPQRILSARDDDGQLHTWLPATPESWERLSKSASLVKERELPDELWRQAEVIPYLGLLLPFRFTSSVAKALDYLTTRCCKVVFDDES
jgi:hypothetical protein